jgi:nucleoside-diphosphate-sugar epimerase
MPRVKTHIIGCGDIGRRVASLYLEVGTKVEAWVRSEVSYQACRDLGLKTHKVNFDQPFGLNAFGNKSHVLYTVPPPPLTKGEPLQQGSYARNIFDTRLQAFLQAIDPGAISKFVLISTTGVYGDCGGAWVDETTPIKPKVDRALRRADAEASLREWAQKNRVDYLILRVPGIYALDRLPLRRLKSGAPMVTRNEAPWTNRIHADDLAAVCFTALNSPIANEIVNVADDAPSSMTEYFFAVADYAGLPRPPEISLQKARQSLSSGMLSYLEESRRIDNSKMKKLLNIKLKYPTLKHGLTLYTPSS